MSGVCNHNDYKTGCCNHQRALCIVDALLEKLEKCHSSDVLFCPLQCGEKVSFGNRIALAPMTRGRATEDFIPTEMMVEYYAQRADAGLVITEATGISRQGLGWFCAPGIYNEEQVSRWQKITKTVHDKGSVIFCQLWHMGRAAHSDVTGQPTVAPSAIRIEGKVTARHGEKKDYEVPQALSEVQIESIVKDYGVAALNAMKAGFDGVEIHGANGYLVDEFLQSCTNKRQDKYGGTLEKRLQFMKDVVNEVVRVLDATDDKGSIGIRLSPNGKFGNMGAVDNIETFDAAIDWLSKQNIGYIHLMDGLTFGFHGKCDAYTLKMAKAIIDKNGSTTLLMGNTGHTKESAIANIKGKTADLISFGRPFISNPDLVFRFKNDVELAPEAPYPTWWKPEYAEKGYTDWPTAEKR